jgi:hypothetical protein
MLVKSNAKQTSLVGPRTRDYRRQVAHLALWQPPMCVSLRTA